MRRSQKQRLLDTLTISKERVCTAFTEVFLVEESTVLLPPAIVVAGR